MKIVSALLAILLLLCGCSAPGTGGKGAGQSLTVYTSFYPMYDFTTKLAGDRATVVNMVPAGSEAHDWEPSARDRAGLEHADLFVYSGAGMEHWVESLLASMEEGSMIVVEAAGEIPLLAGEPHDHEAHDDHEDAHDHGEDDPHDHAHDHGGADPHVWLSPVNAKMQMKAICAGLAQADPENRSYYEENLAYWTERLNELDSAYHLALDGIGDKHIVVSHRAFGYLCEEYGIGQVSAMAYSIDSEPSPADMRAVEDFARDYQVRVVFYESEGSAKIARTVAEAVGAKTALLNPLEAMTTSQIEAGEDYFSVMEQNLQALRQAFE